jgi:hypothetical protein
MAPVEGQLLADPGHPPRVHGESPDFGSSRSRSGSKALTYPVYLPGTENLLAKSLK